MEQSDGDGEKDVGRREGEQVRIPLPPLRCIFPCLRGIFFFALGYLYGTYGLVYNFSLGFILGPCV